MSRSACLAPGKRPLAHDGAPYLAWGPPGGDQQDQWIPQMFLRHVHAGMNLKAGSLCATTLRVETPRFRIFAELRPT